ncbi:PhzF family phenazine biosynthesis protein [Methylocystis echinoides]|jgi:trans-2,3-dihydro-3-hydroxyanthranilate isomerase|uniref:PhzF family phenazine biosynthesis protein n=1 Tax=Methylocystis echinoides TaxID=29468 RepID=UPI003448FEA2
MTGLAYHLVDVFTDRRFSGNPLAIVEGADRLSAEAMRAVAREFNLSETVFLCEPRDPVHSARLRIFTPERELPFAGHPTIGTAALLAETRAGDALARHGVVVALEADVGLLRCEALRGRSGVAYAECALPMTPRQAGPAPTAAALAAALSLKPADIGFDAHVPSAFAAGPAFVFAPIGSRAALDRARRAPAAFAAALGDAAGVFLYTRETVDPAAAVHARMLAQGLGFEEDPATGSAAAAFAAVALAFERPRDGEHEVFIEQGYAMGRPSRITLRMRVENGALAGVAIGGQVMRVGEGRLRL